VRVYTVADGDTPENIAARPEMAGCPRCSRDLILANPHRPHARQANGYLTFVDPLVAGERLWIPDKWRDEVLDALPKSYFENLPDPMGLGQLPQDVPVLYEVQPGDTQEAIALKFGQVDASALFDANPSLPTTTRADGGKEFCSLDPEDTIALPDRWFAAGSSWSAIRPGCNPQDVTVSPAAAAQVADLNHPAPKDITLSVHPAAIAAMQSAHGGARDARATVATTAAGTSAVVGTAVVGTFLAHLVTGAAYGTIQRYVSGVLSDLF
jgi:hypothetical protein